MPGSDDTHRDTEVLICDPVLHNSIPMLHHPVHARGRINMHYYVQMSRSKAIYMFVLT